jgi:hypothetical protein
MVGTVDVDKSTVNILISIGDRSCLQTTSRVPALSRREGFLTIRNLDSNVPRTDSWLAYLRESPQGPPLFSSASSSSSHGYLVFGLRMH